MFGFLLPKEKLKIHLTVPNQKKWYTNGDVIEGVLSVKARKSIPIKSLVLQLRVAEVVSFEYMGKGNIMLDNQFESKDASTHRWTLVEETLLSDASATTQDYPFSITIPPASEEGACFGSFSIGNRSDGITWSLLAILTADHVAANNLYSQQILRVLPDLPHRGPGEVLKKVETSVMLGEGDRGLQSIMSGQSLRALSSGSIQMEPISVEMAVEYPKEGLVQAPDPLDLKVTLSSPKAEDVILTGLKVTLIEEVEMKAANHTQESHRDRVLYAFKGETALTDSKVLADIATLEIKPWIRPSFRSIQITNSYKLYVAAKIAARGDRSVISKLIAVVPVKIWGPSVKTDHESSTAHSGVPHPKSM